MTLSIYTFVKDGLYFDFHVVDMLRHHLPLADQIVVNEGYSTDGSYEAIAGLDPKILVQRSRWDGSEPKAWCAEFKNHARKLCTGNWCIMLDIDEFIPEWEFPRIRQTLAETDKTILPLRYIHFYANYKVINASPESFRWPVIKHTVHRNLEEIDVWGDGSNVGYHGQLDLDSHQVGTEPIAEVHHFGFVRNAARLRQKWRAQAKRTAQNQWDWTPGFIYDLVPHRWADPDILPHLKTYDGPFVKAVRDNPAEFVRDNFELYQVLSRHKATMASERA